jgi:hypothetical protein
MKRAHNCMAGYGWCWIITQCLRRAVVSGVCVVLALVIVGKP